MLSLTPRQRAAVVLRILGDHSEVEAAAMLGVTPGTVMTLTSRGLSGLRRHLGDRESVYGYGTEGHSHE